MRYGNQEPKFRFVQNYTCTDGDDCAELVAHYGLKPFPFQKRILQDWLAYDEETGEYIHNTCVLIVPRQNGKNACLEMYELYQLAVNGRNILHSSHRVDTNRKAFLRLASFFENKRKYPELAKICKSIRKANGQECIEVEIEKDGELVTAKIEFVARSKNAARGFSVDIVVFDEAQELQSEQLEAMIPALAASQHETQTIYTGTVPYPGCLGDSFGNIRDVAYRGEDKHLTLSEWGVDEIGDVRDKERWYETNPSLGYLISEKTIENELTSLSEAGFARERLSWWATEQQLMDYPINKDAWESLGRKEPPELKGSIQCYGVKIDREGHRAAVCVCDKSGTKGLENYHVELICETNSMSELADFLASLPARSCANIIIDSKTLAEDLKHRIVERGVKKSVIIKASASDLYNACATFTNAVNEREQNLTHYDNIGQELLDRSVCGCTRREIGKDGAFGFDDCMEAYAYIAEAVALAYYASRTTTRNPKRKQEIRCY